MDRLHVWPGVRSTAILFEDDDVLAVNKPAWVSCESDAAGSNRLADYAQQVGEFLAARENAPAVTLRVHSLLDDEASGVVLFTKRPSATAKLAAQVEQHCVKTTYIAAVTGWRPHAREAVLDDYLRPGDRGRVEVVGPRASRGGSQRAVTRVRVRSKDTQKGMQAERVLLELETYGVQAVPEIFRQARLWPRSARNRLSAFEHAPQAKTKHHGKSHVLPACRITTMRTHHARVQLAHARAPIAGDATYGGAKAPRLLLHATSVAFSHPQTGKNVVVRAPVPREFHDWMTARQDVGASIYDDSAALTRAISLAAERRSALGQSVLREPASAATSAFRLINEEGDALPGLAVDVYGDHLVVQFYVGDIWDGAFAARRERVLDALHRLGFDGIYLKLRPKQANVLVDTRRDSLAPALPVRGVATAVPEIEIREEGVPYRVRLGDGLSTGIFLDQRLNRRLTREISRGARVLNLFAYTCAFSVVAALGGAARTVSVDAAAAALERGRRNFEAAGIDLGSPSAPVHSFVAEDVFTWLARAASKRERFDLVLVDPPSYSSTKKKRFVAESDFDDLVALAAKVLAPGGRILASCNHRGLSRAKFRRFVTDGMTRETFIDGEKRTLKQVQDLPEAPDFPPPYGRDVAMKSVLATLA